MAPFGTYVFWKKILDPSFTSKIITDLQQLNYIAMSPTIGP